MGFAWLAKWNLVHQKGFARLANWFLVRKKVFCTVCMLFSGNLQVFYKSCKPLAGRPATILHALQTLFFKTASTLKRMKSPKSWRKWGFSIKRGIVLFYFPLEHYIICICINTVCIFMNGRII